jgi:hypothetical protein
MCMKNRRPVVNFRELLLRYQYYDPATGRFDLVRSKTDYATLLGVHPSLLTRVIHGQQDISLKLAHGLARAFPELTPELANAVLRRELVA